MNFLTTTTGVEVVEISPEISAQTNPVPESIGLRLVPTSSKLSAGVSLEAGLWAIAEALDPGARLVVVWRFGLSAKLSGDVSLRIDQAPSLQLSGCDADVSYSAALERASLLALPGFASCLDEVEPLLHQVRVVAPGADVLSPRSVVSLGPVEPRRRRSDHGAVVLPVHSVARLNLENAVRALASTEKRIDLQLMVSNFEVDSGMLRALETADASLCSRLYRERKSPVEGMALELLRSRLGTWRASRTGLRLDFALASPDPIDSHLVATIAGLLFGPGQTSVLHEDIKLDLRGCLTIHSTERPRLMPPARMLADLMLTRPGPSRTPVPDGLVLGHDAANHAVAIGATDRARHMVILGATGVGKSTLMANMIAQDVAAGRGVILIDPHGDLYAQVRDALPREAQERAILADASDFADPFGLNLLEISSEPAAVQRNFIANQLVGVFQSVLYRGVPEAFGPMFGAYFRNALFLLMEAEGKNASLANFDRVFAEPAYRRSLLERCADPQVVRFWKDIATKAGGEAALENIAPYICSKLTQFTGNPLLRPIITAPRTTLDLPSAMDRGDTVLINLAKGLIGEHDAALLGGLITIRIFCAAMARSALSVERRRPVRVYLDEFATYATSAMTQMLAECRKFGLELVLAGQSLDQVDGRADRPDVAHAILANVGSILAFRTGPNDARRLADWFEPEITSATLSRLPDHRLVARLLRCGLPAAPISIWTEVL
ncbi:MAG: type IV secretory system conjugative DNA transfer family protein [Pseudomonadota bacterium]